MFLAKPITFMVEGMVGGVELGTKDRYLQG